MKANDPRGVANLDPRGMIGRICVEYHLTLVMRYIFLPRMRALAEYFFPIPYKIGTFLRSAVSVQIQFWV